MDETGDIVVSGRLLQKCLLTYTVFRSSSNLAKARSSNSPEPCWYWEQQGGSDRGRVTVCHSPGLASLEGRQARLSSSSVEDFPFHSLVFFQDFQICLCSLGGPTLHSDLFFSF